MTVKPAFLMEIRCLWPPGFEPNSPTELNLKGIGMYGVRDMHKHYLALTISLATLTAIPVWAQDYRGPVIVQPDQSQSSETVGQAMHGMDERGRMMGRREMMSPESMMHGGGSGQHHAMMMRMMFALMDADGDGAISLQEFQAAHERLFKAMDGNKDGRLSLEEMQNFLHGAPPSGPR
jgi:hypothetical protein